MIVLAIDPVLRRDAGPFQQLLQRLGGILQILHAGQCETTHLGEIRRFLGFAVIYWRIISKLAGRQIRHYLAVIFHHHLAGIGHKPNLRPRQIPFIKNAFHLFLAPLGDDDEHALLRFAQQNLVGRHARAALRHLGQINLNARAAARGRFAGGTREARRAHVLNARHCAGRQQFQTGLHTELLHEGIAHLHGTALLFGRFLGEIL